MNPLGNAMRKSEGGATIVEFALVSAVLFSLLVTMLAFSLIEVGNTVGGNAAREGARYGIINVDCADSYPGASSAGHDGCSSPSTNYTGIVSAVTSKLVGLVQGTPAVAVRCIDGTSTTPLSSLSTKPCTVAGGTNTPLQPDVDLIEVTVTWTHLGSSPFVASNIHTDVARMIITEAPQAVAPTTTSTSTTSTSTSTTTTTVAGPPKPSMQSVTMYDKNSNGRVDEVDVVFDNPPTGCAVSTMWALTNVPSGGTLSSETVSGNTIVLGIAEGTGAQSTAVSSFKVAFTPSGSCSANSFGATAPVDKAAPVPISISTTHAGSSPGIMQASDAIAITFSEAVTTTATTMTVTETKGTNSVDMITIPGLLAAPTVNNMGGKYISSSDASFSGTISGSGTASLTVTLSGTCSTTGNGVGNNGCSNLVNPGGTPAFTYVPASGIADGAGNAAVANSASSSFNVLLF